MGCELAVGSNYYREFDLVHPSGAFQGEPVNADDIPTVEIRKDGDVVVDSPTVVILNPIVGKYSVEFTVPAWDNGDNIEVYTLFTINSVDYRHSVGGFMVVIVPSDILVDPATPVVSREGIEMIYGEDNIAKWADANNTEDGTKIANRIAWAANRASLYVLGKLALRFGTFETLPALVVELICERAGVELYRSPRGLVDGDPELASINGHAKEVETRIMQLLAGTLKLTDYTDTVTEIPKAICNDNFALDSYKASLELFPTTETLFFQT